MSFKTPILFLVFNRPDCTQKVLESIKKVKPAFLYIAADAPRENNNTDQIEVALVKKIIKENINWDCELKTLFRSENLGCKGAVSSAINWFFEHEEKGIILEDDCLPSEDFFYYCEELLIKFENDSDIISINGCNFGYEFNHASYFFSRYMNVWGWATWRNRAIKINYEIPEWHNLDKMKFLRSRLKKSFPDFDKSWFKYWENIFDDIASGKLNSWAFFWIYHQFNNKLLAILPAKNLIQNIGFHPDATHTTLLTHPAAKLIKNELGFPMIHNLNKVSNRDYEERSLKPVCYMYQSKPNSFFIKNWILGIPGISILNKKFNKK